MAALTELLGRMLVGFGSDGASVKLGRRSGLLAKLQLRLSSMLMGIHCMAHHVNLAASALKAVGESRYLLKHSVSRGGKKAGDDWACRCHVMPVSRRRSNRPTNSSKTR